MRNICAPQVVLEGCRNAASLWGSPAARAGGGEVWRSKAGVQMELARRGTRSEGLQEWGCWIRICIAAGVRGWLFSQASAPLPAACLLEFVSLGWELNTG